MSPIYEFVCEQHEPLQVVEKLMPSCEATLEHPPCPTCTYPMRFRWGSYNIMGEWEKHIDNHLPVHLGGKWSGGREAPPRRTYFGI